MAALSREPRYGDVLRWPGQDYYVIVLLSPSGHDNYVSFTGVSVRDGGGVWGRGVEGGWVWPGKWELVSEGTDVR